MCVSPTGPNKTIVDEELGCRISGVKNYFGFDHIGANISGRFRFANTTVVHVHFSLEGAGLRDMLIIARERFMLRKWI